MFFKAERDDMQSIRQEATQIFNEQGGKPKIFSRDAMNTFGSELTYALKLISEEKEILLFAVLQAAVVFLAYLLWVQMLAWIPDSVWNAVEQSSNNGHDQFDVINWILLIWSFLVVAVASFPLGILSAAMIAAHYLRSSNQESTIKKCIHLGFKHMGRLWVFTTLDNWITVNQILDRLPKKGRQTNSAVQEFVYYAWKVGSVGILPSLVAGKSFLEAAKDSIAMLKSNIPRIVGIRMGYSAICWVIGIAAYIGAVFFLIGTGVLEAKVHRIYYFYLYAIVPISIAASIILVFIRPLYLIMISKAYSDLIPIEPRELRAHPTDKRSYGLFIFFGILLATLLFFYFFGNEIGFLQWMSSVAVQELQ